MSESLSGPAPPLGVERTFARLGRYRRLSQDDEVLQATTEAWMSRAMRRLTTVRLAN